MKQTAIPFEKHIEKRSREIKQRERHWYKIKRQTYKKYNLKEPDV